jgi:DNA-directed RNA polymerase subunit RPC12/RpoP
MREIKKYYCSKCGTLVDDEINCPKCKSLLAVEGAVRVKKVKISDEKLRSLENIYNDEFDISHLTKSEKNEFKQHQIKRAFPAWLCVVLHFITLGIFPFFYFGMKHGQLPKIKDDDPSAGKAIGFMFIPFFNIYWRFIFWLRLVDRLNFQHRLRSERITINRGLVLASLIIGLIPYVGLIAFLFIEPVIFYKIQIAVNTLVNPETRNK